MRISSRESNRGFQPSLDLELEPIRLPFAACRSHIGDFFELATATLLEGIRLRTDSTCDVCPDVYSQKVGVYAESKSVGLNNQMALYQCRFEKDQAFITDQNCRLWYVFWRHRFAVSTEGTDLGTLRAGAARTCYAVHLVDFGTLSGLVGGLKVTTLNKPRPDSPVRMGYGSRGYNDGWRVPMKAISGVTHHSRGVLGIRPYGVEIAPIKLYADDVVAPFLECLRTN